MMKGEHTVWKNNPTNHTETTEAKIDDIPTPVSEPEPELKSPDSSREQSVGTPVVSQESEPAVTGPTDPTATPLPPRHSPDPGQSVSEANTPAPAAVVKQSKSRSGSSNRRGSGGKNLMKNSKSSSGGAKRSSGKSSKAKAPSKPKGIPGKGTGGRRTGGGAARNSSR